MQLETGQEAGTTNGAAAEAARPRLPEAKITEEGINKLRDLVGHWMRTEHYTEEASLDTLKRFVNGAGDLNPLYRDREYARTTIYGDIIAHPCFPYARHYPGRTRFGLSGVHGFYAGTDWEFYDSYRIGDVLNCRERLIDVSVKESRFSGTLVVTTCECFYTTQDGKLIAKAYGWSTRHERRAAREKGKYKDISAHQYSDEEIDSITREALEERKHIRGAEPRYWENVQVGEEIKPVVRGPLTLLDLTAWNVGNGRGRAHGLVLEEALQHPGHFFRNAEVKGGMEYTGIGHARDSVAREVGAPGTYDYGPQRITWTCSVVTNWMGDYGILRRLRSELRRFNTLGDTTWCKGKVVDKYVRDGEHRVDLELWAENQRGELTTPGLATVALPTRSVELPAWLAKKPG